MLIKIQLLRVFHTAIFFSVLKVFIVVVGKMDTHSHIHAHTAMATMALHETNFMTTSSPHFSTSFSDAIIEPEPSHNHISGHYDGHAMSGEFHNDNFSIGGSTNFHGHNSISMGTGGTFNDGHGSWSVGGSTNFHGGNSIGGSIGWDF